MAPTGTRTPVTGPATTSQLPTVSILTVTNTMVLVGSTNVRPTSGSTRNLEKDYRNPVVLILVSVFSTFYLWLVVNWLVVLHLKRLIISSLVAQYVFKALFMFCFMVHLVIFLLDGKALPMVLGTLRLWRKVGPNLNTAKCFRVSHDGSIPLSETSLRCI